MVEVTQVGKGQELAPLFSGLVEYLATNPAPFHVPGHKGGKWMDPEFREFFGERALAFDLTNINPLDDLHQPKSLIREAQKLAAEAFGADYSWFSVQGTSTAIMAMIMAVCNPGDKLILPRNIHRSVLSGLICSGAKPIFLYPKLDPLLGVGRGVSAAQVLEALNEHPDAKGVLLVHPTYFGFATDLQEIVRLVHSRGAVVLVDEAHGSHVHFHEKLPVSAMQAGADLAATSVHKLGGALTQSSILHLKGDRIAPARVQTMLNTLTTTSASFLLLCSLDLARRNLALRGYEQMEMAINLAEQVRKEINEIPCLFCPGGEVGFYDPTKLVVYVRDLGITGHQAELWLGQYHGVQVELGDLNNILAIITAGDDHITVTRLVEALHALSSQFRTGDHKLHYQDRMVECSQPRLALTPRDAFYAPQKAVSLPKSLGCIVGEWIMTYPPGIPLILPGEVMDEATYEHILHCLGAGLTILGTEDQSLRTIRIVRSS